MRVHQLFTYNMNMHYRKRLYNMAFVKRTLKLNRACLSTGSYTSVVENLIPPTLGDEDVKINTLSVMNHEMSHSHEQSIDSACMIQADTESFADTEGTTH